MMRLQTPIIGVAKCVGVSSEPETLTRFDTASPTASYHVLPAAAEGAQCE